MRGRALLVLACLALAAAPSVTADNPKNHFTQTVVDLEPGETKDLHPGYEGGPMQEGWIFLVVGGVVSEETPVDVSLTLDGEVVHAWSWESHGGATQFVTTTLPETSEDYHLSFTNPGDETIRVYYYFDYTCNCVQKPLANLPVTYQLWDFQHYEGEQVWMDWNVPENTTIQYEVLRLTGADGHYPNDFEKVAVAPRDALPNGTVTWQVEEDETYYFLVGVAGGEPQQFVTPAGRVSYFKDTNTGQDPTNDTPSPGALALIAVAGAVAVALLPRGRRGRPRA